MMRSMYSAVSGLRAHQTKMDVIGNNIANVNTVGFKSGRVTFEDVFSQTLQGASGSNEETGIAGTNPMQVGLGVNVSSIDTLMTEGAAQRTDNPLDLKIEGDGFFIVRDAEGYKFTRAGAFTIDESGYLANSDGLKLMGWLPDDDGEIVQSQVQELQILSPENLYSEPEMTTNAYVEGNINKNDSQLTSTDGVPFNVRFYDSLGYSYTAEFSVKESGTNSYDIAIESITDSEGNVLTGSFSGNATVVFDPSTGKVTSGTSLSVTGMSSLTGFSELADPLEVDLSQLTYFDQETSLESVRGDLDGQGAGRQSGTMSGFSVGSDGKVTATYSNGDQIVLAQIVTTEFSNPAGLEKVGGNLFVATMNSGEFDGIGQDPTASGGSLNAGVLEMSNVDLSLEFTEMITTQRGFQANSRIITSSDEMLQELVNLKR